MVGDQVRAFGDEDAHLPDLELDPGQRQFRQQLDQGAFGLADFADQQAVAVQMQRRIAQDPQREIQAVVAGTQAELRFVRVLARQRVGLVVGDLRLQPWPERTRGGRRCLGGFAGRARDVLHNSSRRVIARPRAVCVVALHSQ